MAKSNHKLNIEAFKRQRAEAVIGQDNLYELEVDSAGTASVWIRIPDDPVSDADYRAALARASSSPKEFALELLSHKPGVSAEEQWATVMESQGADGEDEALDLFLGAAEKAVEIVAKRKENFEYRG